MNNPSPELIQAEVAKRLGMYEWFHANREALPPWPTSHDAARTLEITDWGKFGDILINITDAFTDLAAILQATPTQWCLAWLRSEHGVEWVPCEGCVDGVLHYTDLIQESTICPTCSGASGKFEVAK